MDKQYTFDEMPNQIPRPVLAYAISKTPKFRGLCIMIKDVKYYESVYNKRRGNMDETVEKSLLEPIIKNSPEFSQGLRDGLSLYIQKVEQSLTGTVATMMEEVERALLIMHGVHKKLDQLRMGDNTSGKAIKLDD